MSFDATGLDPRLLRALAKRGFDKPTPVQVRRLPGQLRALPCEEVSERPD